MTMSPNLKPMSVEPIFYSLLSDLTEISERALKDPVINENFLLKVSEIKTLLYQCVKIGSISIFLEEKIYELANLINQYRCHRYVSSDTIERISKIVEMADEYHKNK